MSNETSCGMPDVPPGRNPCASFPAFELAASWCAENEGWARICDIEHSDRLMLTWQDLPERVKQLWRRAYPGTPQEAWREFGNTPHLHRFGFIADDGKFYSDRRRIPVEMNTMMVFETGGPPGAYYRGGRKSANHARR